MITHVGRVPSGYDAMLLANLCALNFARNKRPTLHIASDDQRLAGLKAMVQFFNPKLEILMFPSWDCQPYDRVSPHTNITATRMATLNQLTTRTSVEATVKLKKPLLILTTINAALQRVAPRSTVAGSSLSARIGDELPMQTIIDFLSTNGYVRSSQVMEHGEFAVRGGLLDLFPPSAEKPIRLDFFGDEIETIRTFDPLNQLSTGQQKSFDLIAACEFSLNEDSRKFFQRSYTSSFGPPNSDDALYASVKEGRRFQGAEHWLPFFHESMQSLLDYIQNPFISFDPQVDEAATARIEAINDYYEARREVWDIEKSSKNNGPTLAPSYKPIRPELLYLRKNEWDRLKESYHFIQFSPFEVPSLDAINLNAKQGRDFAPERGQKNTNIYDAVKDHVDTLLKAQKRVVFGCYTLGSAERMKAVLTDHNISQAHMAETWADIMHESGNGVAITVLPIEHGFETSEVAVLSEQDILGDRLIRKVRRNRHADSFLTEASALNPGDMVVHANHGVGQFIGLETVRVSNAAHDCLLLTYHGGDKLYVPVENIEVLTRFGNEASTNALDKLGGVAWQARKAKAKNRIREMAGELIKLAAERALREGQRITISEGMYAEFCARFPYEETDDQIRSIADIIADLSSGTPMDRLICGDVGFGKTEVALRAAFLSVMAGHQVAIIAPTTLLARQHFITFSDRFRGLPVRIAQLSRLVNAKNSKITKSEMRDGTLDIIIGTHALLAEGIKFRDLGLLIIDEEQHFGVAHKEKLKSLKSNVHVLTLTATPIPRTLQMAMSGIRDLSIIATPPVDRLAVRTYVTPFDPVVLREALLREHYRGGQSFYVCPRIADIAEVSRFLRDHVPEIKFVVGHGQMTPRQIEDVMTAFYEGQYDVLLSTTIVESGIDIPTANTMIIHRADMFGLAQLYQLRGRVGRSKVRAYAYLSIPAKRVLSESADKRLKVLQSLDTLGAGFTLASHDMDIRGAGNLLGDEQSGHVREVGVELYQKMLEDAVAEARAGLNDEDYTDADWSPQINLGATVLIPEKYVPDLTQRMALYRRLADLNTREDVDAFCAELIDRFGPLPGAVKQLAAIMIIKGHCKRAGIEKLEAGPKGVTLSFKEDRFSNPAGLVDFITSTGSVAKLRPDHKLVYYARMDKISARLKTTALISRKLAAISVNSDK